MASIVQGSISLLFKKLSTENGIVDLIQQAAMYSIVENAYLREAPQGLTGDLRGEIKTKKTTEGFETKSTAVSKQGKPYPEYLHEGTGALKGSNDYGFTYGRINADDVAYGIGGIRPNKFAMRGAKKAEPLLNKFVESKLEQLIKKQIDINKI